MVSIINFPRRSQNHQYVSRTFVSSLFFHKNIRKENTIRKLQQYFIYTFSKFPTIFLQEIHINNNIIMYTHNVYRTHRHCNIRRARRISFVVVLYLIHIYYIINSKVFYYLRRWITYSGCGRYYNNIIFVRVQQNVSR